MDTRTVLVVAANPTDRELYGGWLEEEGFEVISCPGPTAPDYECVGGRTGTCALADGADLVLLDSSLPGDDLSEGTSATELATLYASLGKLVVVVATLRRDVAPPADWLRWPTSGHELVAAVRSTFDSMAAVSRPIGSFAKGEGQVGRRWGSSRIGRCCWKFEPSSGRARTAPPVPQ